MSAGTRCDSCGKFVEKGNTPETWITMLGSWDRRWDACSTACAAKVLPLIDADDHALLVAEADGLGQSSQWGSS